MESISSLSEHTKKTFQRIKLQSDTNIYILQNPVSRAARSIKSFLFFIYHPSTTPCKRTIPTHCVEPNLMTNLSVHLLQKTLLVIRVTVQFTPLIVQDLAAEASALETCSKPQTQIRMQRHVWSHLA